MNSTEYLNIGNDPYYLPHESYLSGENIDTCRNVLRFPKEERCDYIRNTKDCRVNPVGYVLMEYVLCRLNSSLTITAVVFFFWWLSFMIKQFIVNAESNVVPMFIVCVRKLHLGVHFAGITILAIVNTGSSIISSFWLYRQASEIQINELMGSAMFITALTGGLLITLRPFQLEPLLVVNDLAWYLCAVLWIQFILLDEIVSNTEAITCLAIYMLYLTSSSAVEYGNRKSLEKERHAFNARVTDIITERNNEWRAIVDGIDDSNWSGWKKFKNAWKDFLWYAKVRMNYPKWRKSNFVQKFIILIMSPANVYIMLLIPTVDYRLPRNGWCKIAFACNLFFMVLLFDIEFWQQLIISSALVVIAVIIFEVNKAPKHHEWVAVVGLICSGMLIRRLIDHLGSSLMILLTFLGMSQQSISLSALAFNNSIGNHVCILLLAVDGFQHSAFAASIGTQLFSLLLRISTIFLMRNFTDGTCSTKARQGTMGFTSGIFLIIFLMLLLFLFVIVRYQARRSVGVFMIIFYGVYAIFFTLIEKGLVHPFGSDHFDETDEYI